MILSLIPTSSIRKTATGLLIIMNRQRVLMTQKNWNSVLSNVTVRNDGSAMSAIRLSVTMGVIFDGVPRTVTSPYERKQKGKLLRGISGSNSYWRTRWKLFRVSVGTASSDL